MTDKLEHANKRIWRNQANFQAWARESFDEILEELNCKLDRNILLVGFQTDRMNEPPVVHVDAEFDAFPVVELAEMFEDIRDQYAPYPDDDLSDVDWNAAYHKHELFGWELSVGIRNVLKAELDPEKALCFCSTPYQIKNHLISVVMLVSRRDYEAQPHLTEAVSLEARGLWPSFLYAVIETFLEQLAPEMIKPDRGSLFYLKSRDPKELLRSAGARFTHTAGRAGRQPDPQYILKHGVYDLFKACNVISSLRYEGAESAGHLVISEKGHPAIMLKLEFDRPIDPNDYQKVRKLLEMCDKDTWLLYSEREVYGLGFVPDGRYDPKDEDLFVVRFVKHHSWDLMHGKLVLMRTTYNEPRLPRTNFDLEELRVKLKSFIPTITDPVVENLVSVAQMASEAKHGTMLVITPEAAAEVKRLASQSFPVKPFPLTLMQLPSVSSIDGAVVLDEEGKCHGIGVILDGHASELGTSARGARFNSAIRYVQENQQAVALVVSEDGMVNVVTFKPQPKQESIGPN